MSTHMIDHLQMLILSGIFNPVFLAFLIGVFILGRILGRYIPWQGVGRPMVVVFSIGLIVKLFMFQNGYDLYFMLGFPFIAGIWGASVKHSP